MEIEKERVLALAVHTIASIIEYAVVMAVQYMEITGDDAVSDQVRQGCISILAQLDAIQGCAISQNRRKRKRKLRFLARRTLLDTHIFNTFEEPYQLMFNMDSATLDWFCDQVGPFVERQNSDYKNSIPFRKTVAMALFRLATGANNSVVAERFSVGESTVLSCVREVIEIICCRCSHVVAYPKGESLRKVIAGFEGISGLPNCVGAIDCLRLRIRYPAALGGFEYLDPEMIHTIVTQAAVDSRCRVLSLVTGFSGDLSDEGVLKSSSLYGNIQSGRFFSVPPMDIEGVSIPSYLVGGPTYQLKPWLMIPYPGDELDAFEYTFNSAVSQALKTIDETFHSLKRWKILLKVLNVDFPTAVRMIEAICIIHNMLLDKPDPYNGEVHNEDLMQEASSQELVTSPHLDDDFAGDFRVAQSMRDALATYLITM